MTVKENSIFEDTLSVESDLAASFYSLASVTLKGGLGVEKTSSLVVTLRYKVQQLAVVAALVRLRSPGVSGSAQMVTLLARLLLKTPLRLPH